MRPFYYYLCKRNGVNLKRENERVCPKCGNKKWKLDEPLFNCFDFKCDRCRLLSNVAFSMI
jgi:predicted  nucleic acid-binding Zn ribbon protein